MKMPELMRPMSPKRRTFLKLSGLLGLGAATAAVLPLEAAETLLFGKKEYKVSSTRLVMGSFLSITAIHHSRDAAEEAIGRAFDEVARLSAILSRHDSSTPVAALNQTGSLRQAPPELRELVAKSIDYHRLTGGAFDITVQPLVDLYRDRFAAGARPEEQEILALLPQMGTEHLQLTGKDLRLSKEGMGITLDGIAPGYIVDRLSAQLKRVGVVNHLINASGDIRTSGHAAKGKPWTVAIQDPAKQKAYPELLALGAGAVSTSGSYEIFYDKEKMFHHIVNAKTGHSPRQAVSVTTRAANLMDADALATGLMVLPPTEALRLANSNSGWQCLIIDRDGGLHRSAGWQTVG